MKGLKNIITLMMAAVLTLTAFSVPVWAAGNIVAVQINGSTIDFDVPAQIIGGRIMVPVREIFESLGAVVNWDDITQTISATKGSDTIVMKINSNIMTINGQAVNSALDVPPTIVGGRTMVPVRAVADAFGCSVNWDASANLVSIFTKTQLNLPATASAYDMIQPKNLFVNPDGSMGSLVADSGTIYIKAYDSSGNVIRDQTLPYELPLFGAFYAGQSYNYIMFGQNNPNLDQNAEVVRIVKYDKDFNKLSAVSISAGDSDTITPYSFSSARMAENGNQLYIAFGRTLLRTDDNSVHHQALESIILNTDTMLVTNFFGLAAAGLLQPLFQPAHRI